jgi:hypothetical protein
LEKKFLRMLVVVDAGVLDEDMDNGGDGGGGDGDGGGGNGGNRIRTKFILSPLIKDPPSSYDEWLPPGGRERGRG